MTKRDNLMTKSNNWKIVSNIIECQAGMVDIVIEWQIDILKDKYTSFNNKHT